MADEEGLEEPDSSSSSSLRDIPSAVYGSMSSIHGNCNNKYTFLGYYLIHINYSSRQSFFFVNYQTGEIIKWLW